MADNFSQGFANGRENTSAFT